VLLYTTNNEKLTTNNHLLTTEYAEYTEISDRCAHEG
jgi:hypothetical protein